MSIKNITIEINGVDINMPIEEAERLFMVLSKHFNPPEPVKIYPYPYHPDPNPFLSPSYEVTTALPGVSTCGRLPIGFNS